MRASAAGPGGGATNSRRSIAARRRSLGKAAVSWLAPEASATNSSPPKRATTSLVRTAFLMPFATPARTRSSAGRPNWVVEALEVIHVDRGRACGRSAFKPSMGA
jgi:hypothetical protein